MVLDWWRTWSKRMMLIWGSAGRLMTMAFGEISGSRLCEKGSSDLLGTLPSWLAKHLGSATRSVISAGRDSKPWQNLLDEGLASYATWLNSAQANGRLSFWGGPAEPSSRFLLFMRDMDLNASALTWRTCPMRILNLLAATVLHG